MSTAVQTFADKTADITAATVTRKKRQTPYKPVLSTIVKDVMEASVEEAIKAQEVMEEILTWLDEERRLREDLRADISSLAPLDHRMQMLLRREVECLLRIGRLENRIARLAILITAMERRLSLTLVNSRAARPGDSRPPRELKLGNGEPS